MTSEFHPVGGSERAGRERPRPVGRPDDHQRVAVTVLVRRREPLRERLPTALADAAAAGRLARPLDHAEFTERYGADPADLDRVVRFARERGLQVLAADPRSRAVRLAGGAAAVSAAFGVTLGTYEHDGARYHGREGAVRVPAELAEVVQAVLGLDDEPKARPHLCLGAAAEARPEDGPAEGTGAPAQAPCLTAAEVARLYGVPEHLDGTGQCVAFIELGGGYLPDDLRAYAAKLGLPEPSLTCVPVDGTANSPAPAGGPTTSADAEVALDVEVAMAVAPRARFVVYFAPNTERGFIDAVHAAVHDTDHRPDVISISWGAPESQWTGQAAQAFDEAFADAAALGISVCCSSGDRGSAAGLGDGRAHVELPASAPHALACGGTRLGVEGGRVASEVVWNDFSGISGGGVSEVFGVPAWQAEAGVPVSANPGGRAGRGVPDVAANAACSTAYWVLVRGRWQAVGGTSAVAPLWAALCALANQRLGRRVGHPAPFLYRSPAARAAFRDVGDGTNGGYRAGPGWDACTGLGVADLTALMAALDGLTRT